MGVRTSSDTQKGKQGWKDLPARTQKGTTTAGLKKGRRNVTLATWANWTTLQGTQGGKQKEAHMKEAKERRTAQGDGRPKEANMQARTTAQTKEIHQGKNGKKLEGEEKDKQQKGGNASRMLGVRGKLTVYSLPVTRGACALLEGDG